MSDDMNKKIDAVQAVADAYHVKVSVAIGNFWETATDAVRPDRRGSVPETGAHINHKLHKIFDNMMPKTTLSLESTPAEFR